MASRPWPASSEPVPHLPSVERWRKGNRAKPYDPNAEAIPPGNALVRLRPVPRRILLPRRGQTPHLPVAQRPEGRAHPRLLRQAELQGQPPHKDWTHKDTGAPVLKAQHPEFELWSQGTHARAGVACADCHMPYVRDGAVKVSSHHVRSPLLDVARSCQTCHRTDEESLRQRVATIQERTNNLMDRSLNAAHRTHRRPETSHGRRHDRRATRPRAPIPAPSLMADRLRQRGKLHGLPRPAGIRTHPRRSLRLRPPRPDRAAPHPAIHRSVGIARRARSSTACSGAAQ